MDGVRNQISGSVATKKSGMDATSHMAIGALLLFVGGLLVAVGDFGLFVGAVAGIIGWAEFMIGVIAQGVKIGLREKD